MGIVYSFCFGEPTGREAAYQVDEEEPKEYSWDKRNKLDPKNFMLDGLENATEIKTSGQIAGQQFIIQNCKSSKLCLFDYSASVNVDDCSDCSIYIGPCKGRGALKFSVFIRDCDNCRFVLACQQFRTRDCRNLDVFLFCQTQPIIEETKQIRFACMQLHYPQLSAQFDSAGLTLFNNRWSNIHDFTPAGKGEGTNYSYCDLSADQDNFVSFQDLGELAAPTVSWTKDTSVVPFTFGMRKKPSKTICFVVLFSPEEGVSLLRNRCSNLIQSIQKCEDAFLVCTKELSMQPQDLERTLETAAHKELAGKGPLIGLELCGAEAAEQCKSVAEKEGFSHQMFISDNPEKHLRNFYSFADMQLGV